MKTPSLFTVGVLALILSSTGAQAGTGMQPESSVVIVEESDGEGVMNVKNNDNFPVLLLTSIENTRHDTESLLTVTPPTARVEPGKNQRVRFILTHPEPLKTERLKRVIFEGVPPQKKDKNEVRMTVRQNLPVVIRPAGLARDLAPWKHLVWKQGAGTLTVNNPSPYVVRLSQVVKTLPDNVEWKLEDSYVLPGQTLTLRPEGNKKPAVAQQVRLFPATTWGYSVDKYEAPLSH